jgi:hypothetical protein
MENYQRNQGKKPKKFHYTYQDIADEVGLAQRTIRKYAQQGLFNPNDLLSVVEFISVRL